jgi:superfamily II DNA or RNA helicase
MLTDRIFKPAYISNEIPGPIDFFQEALSESCLLEIGLGYFSTAAINVLSCGFARFISNEGTLRLYINQDITKADYELLKKGNSPDFDKRLVDSFEEMKKTFSEYNEHFFTCLSYLISTKRIDIKIVVPIKEGIAHEKFGLFHDYKGNTISFIGSLNFTSAAFLKNQESIDCSCSWKGEDSREKVETYRKRWERVWSKKDPNFHVYDAHDFCNEIMKEYPCGKLDEIIAKEERLIEQLKQERRQRKMNQQKVEEEIELKMSIQRGPHFPDAYKNGPLPYQVEAYQNWVSHDCQGIFAMATGTGKTVTSLNCALNEYKKDKYYHLIITVPSKALVEQWEKEVKKFGFGENIIPVSSMNPQWKQEIGDLRTFLDIDPETNFVIIVTYDSFIRNSFTSLLPIISKNAILIADEVHNVGATGRLPAFEQLSITRRIGLSATPNRAYDKDGTDRVAHIFGETSSPFTYEFTMKKAIDENRLCHYDYRPRIAYLSEDEMERYVKLTRQIMSLNVSETSSSEIKEREKSLRMRRKSILHKCENKLSVFNNILEEIGNEKFKYAFVYCPEGSPSQDDYSPEEAKKLIQEIIANAKSTYPYKNFSIFTGETSDEQRNALLEAFSEGEIDALFAMKCLDEGVDVPRAEIGIFLSSTGNPRQFIQRRGRLLRLHDDKEKATIYDIIVSPDFHSPHYDESFYQIERNLVKTELCRVAHFASIADNYYGKNNDGIYNSLKELTDKYGLSIAELISEIEN